MDREKRELANIHSNEIETRINCAELRTECAQKAGYSAVIVQDV